MELGSHGARSVKYYYYILGNLSNSDESMELCSHGARFVNYYYYILGTRPNADESMEIVRHGANYVYYYYYILGSIRKSGRIHGALHSWNKVRLLLLLHSRQST